MDVVAAKIIALVILTALTMVAGLLPVKLAKFVGKSLIKMDGTIQYLLNASRCFSGGVFLAACFLHLIPETRDKVKEVMKYLGSTSQYPVAELLTMSGFYAVLFVEQIIQLVYRRMRNQSRKMVGGENTNPHTIHNHHPGGSLNMSGIGNLGSTPLGGFSVSGGLMGSSCVSSGLANIPNNGTSSCGLGGGGVLPREILPTTEELSLNSLSNEEYATGTVIEANVEIQDGIVAEAESIDSVSIQEFELKRVVDELKDPDADRHVYIRSIIFIIALSFHGIFEEMTLGLQNLQSNVWTLCFAIAVHRCVLAFGIGYQLTKENEGQGMACFCVGCFTLILGIGIITGISISSSTKLYSHVNVPDAILQSVATGTIFYIIFFDILFKDLQGHDDLRRISCTFVGFCMMAVIFAISQS
ncbi:zinc transporter ZIP3-like [Argonauta hians]